MPDYGSLYPDEIRGEEAVEYFKVHRDYLKKLTKKQPELAEQAYTAEDIECITNVGKCAVVLSVESGAALGGKLENVDMLADSGVKMLTLVWNGINELGSGHNTEQGLTDFGKQVIRKMEERKIIVDVSHLNDPGFEDVCEIATKPFIATHSNLRAVCSHRRILRMISSKRLLEEKACRSELI